MHSLITVAEALSILASGAAAVLFFLRLIRLIVLWCEALRSMIAMRPQVAQIVGQLMPNGGSSIVDRVGKVERSVGRLETNYADLKTVNDSQLQRLIRIEQAVNELTNHSEK